MPPSKPSLEDTSTLRDFITRIAQGIYIVTPSGRIVDANPALLEIFGASSLEELQQYRSEDLVPDDAARAERRRLLAEHGWLRNYEYRIRRLDGSLRTVRDTVFTQRDDSGQVVALHGILSDVTMRAPVPDADQDESGPEASLGSFFTGAPAGLAILDHELRFLRINRTLARMHRLAVDDHLGRDLQEALPGLAPALQPVLERVLRTGRPALNFEVTTAEPTISEEVRHWRFSCFPVGPAEEEPTAVGLVVVDVTEARRIEREVRRDQQYLNALIEGSPLAMVTVDEEGRVVTANRAFERLFLYPRSEITGRGLDELIVPPEERAHARSMTLRTAAGETLRTEGRRRRRDGSTVDVIIYSAPIVLDGRQIGSYGIYEDLTMRRAAAGEPDDT